ncbi:hypothetical protein DRQ05_01675 [bacterium]|nr:MAG: hypothetical protein DRQ05_01675 [bacterium]
MRVFRLAVVAAVAISISLVGCSKGDSSKKKNGAKSNVTIKNEQEAKSMAVKVNDQVITEQEVAQEETRLKQQLAGQVPPEQMAQMDGVIRKQAVDNLISKVLLEQEVNKENIEIDEKKVQDRMNEIKGQFPSEDVFNERLKALGLTTEDLLKDIRDGYGIEALLDRETGKVTDATDSEVAAFYKENIDQFKQPEKVRASHILVAVQQGESDSSKAEKRLKAAKILGELKNGANFEELAKRYSDCPSKSKGGDLGYFERGRMVKEFEDAAFALKPGELSGIVETRFGYHIIKVTDRKPARTIPLTEAEADVRSYLTGEKKKQAVEDYISKLKSESTIEWPDSTKAQGE